MCSRPGCRISRYAMRHSSRVWIDPLARAVMTLVAAVAVCGGSAFGPGSVSRAAECPDCAPRARFAAVAFGYFVLFNADSVVSAVDRAFPGKGRAFTEVWRTRQFEYAWLRSMAGRYVDFSKVTEDAVVYAANAVQVELTASKKRQLIDAYLRLT